MAAGLRNTGVPTLVMARGTDAISGQNIIGKARRGPASRRCRARSPRAIPTEIYDRAVRDARPAIAARIPRAASTIGAAARGEQTAQRLADDFAQQAVQARSAHSTPPRTRPPAASQRSARSKPRSASGQLGLGYGQLGHDYDTPRVSSTASRGHGSASRLADAGPDPATDAAGRGRPARCHDARRRSSRWRCSSSRGRRGPSLLAGLNLPLEYQQALYT